MAGDPSSPGFAGQEYGTRVLSSQSLTTRNAADLYSRMHLGEGSWYAQCRSALHWMCIAVNLSGDTMSQDACALLERLIDPLTMS